MSGPPKRQQKLRRRYERYAKVLVCGINWGRTYKPAMTSAQTRLAETIESFYGAADRTSDGAMAGHSFKSAVQELDTSVQRELV